MAFRSKNLHLKNPRVGSADDDTGDAGLGSAEYTYVSLTADDNLAAMLTDGFITNAEDYGIKVNDVVDFIEVGVGATRAIVSGIGGAVAGAADTIAFT